MAALFRIGSGHVFGCQHINRERFWRKPFSSRNNISRFNCKPACLCCQQRIGPWLTSGHPAIDDHRTGSKGRPSYNFKIPELRWLKILTNCILQFELNFKDAVLKNTRRRNCCRQWGFLCPRCKARKRDQQDREDTQQLKSSFSHALICKGVVQLCDPQQYRLQWWWGSRYAWLSRLLYKRIPVSAIHLRFAV